METVLLDEFEANCHRFLEQVETSSNTLVLIKDGQPYAQILPYYPPKKSLFGLYKNQIEIRGDIISPIDTEWEVVN